MYYILHSYTRVSQKKEDVINKIIQKRKYVYNTYWKTVVYQWTHAVQTCVVQGYIVLTYWRFWLQAFSTVTFLVVVFQRKYLHAALQDNMNIKERSSRLSSVEMGLCIKYVNMPKGMKRVGSSVLTAMGSVSGDLRSPLCLCISYVGDSLQGAELCRCVRFPSWFGCLKMVSVVRIMVRRPGCLLSILPKGV